MTEHGDDNTRGALFVMCAGGRLFAVFAEEVEATAEGLAAAPLPRAPEAVRGVVSLRGRVPTAPDPLSIFAALDAAAATSATDANAIGHAAPRFFVALRGDEQL